MADDPRRMHRREAGGADLRRFPALLTPFVGRRAEVGELSELLPRSRLLTITGMGGVGKTRLALELAAEADLGATYPLGVHVVELAAVTDTASVPVAVAAALGIEVGTMLDGPGTAARIAEQLADDRVLLVLDNCEHVVRSCAELVTGLLLHCPGLTVLATSREVLGLGAELVWPTPALSLPPVDATHASDLAGSDAAALFCGRVGAVRPGFVPDATTVPAIAQICHRLDGIALALELAAARARVLEITEIAERLDDRFTLLGGGARLASTHHQTLRAAMDWSYDFLLPDEQVALRRLAVFPGSFDLAAADAVIADVPPALRGRRRGTGSVDVLARLVDKSLLTATSTGSATRYRLLETVREYALERVDEAGESALAQERHRAWFVGLAREWRARPGDPWWSDNAWPVRLSADEASFRAAVVNALEAHDTEAALDLVAALWMFWLMSFRAEGIDLLERAVAQSEGSTVSSRVTALYGLAYLISYHEQVDTARTVALMDQAVALDEAVHGDQSDWMAHHGRADFALRHGDLTTAQAAAEAALRRAQAIGVPVGIAYCERLLGWVATAQGDLALALRRFEKSLNQGWHCDLSTAHAAAAIAPLVAGAGDTARAADLVAEALERARRSPMRLVEAMALIQACKVAVLIGDLSEAEEQAGELFALSARIGATAWLADALGVGVLVLAMTGRHPAAARLAGACDALREARRETGMPDLATEQAAARAQCAASLGVLEWERQHAAGRAMPAAEALAFARATFATDTAQPPPPPTGQATDGTPGAGARAATLLRNGKAWEITYGGSHAYIRDMKGMQDLAVLLSRPFRDVHVLELASPDARQAASASPGAPVLDATALTSYRRRLAELDDEEATAVHRKDGELLQHIDTERARLQAELRSAVGLRGRRRPLGGDPAERARKAVYARLREATRRIGDAIPELGAHLDRSLLTGTFCRYAPDEHVGWVVRPR